MLKLFGKNEVVFPMNFPSLLTMESIGYLKMSLLLAQKSKADIFRWDMVI